MVTGVNGNLGMTVHLLVVEVRRGEVENVIVLPPQEEGADCEKDDGSQTAQCGLDACPGLMYLYYYVYSRLL